MLFSFDRGSPETSIHRSFAVRVTLALQLHPSTSYTSINMARATSNPSYDTEPLGPYVRQVCPVLLGRLHGAVRRLRWTGEYVERAVADGIMTGATVLRMHNLENLHVQLARASQEAERALVTARRTYSALERELAEARLARMGERARRPK
jgi:hypothetical protein